MGWIMLDVSKLTTADFDGTVTVNGHTHGWFDDMDRGNRRVTVFTVTGQPTIIGVVKIDDSTENSEFIDYCFDCTGPLNYWEFNEKTGEEIARYVAGVLA